MSDFVGADQMVTSGQALERLRVNMRQTIKGKDEVIEQVLIALLAGGHVLIEDMPGVGNTTLAYALARWMDCDFSRIQFTNDLLPGDVTGVAIYDEADKNFDPFDLLCFSFGLCCHCDTCDVFRFGLV